MLRRFVVSLAMGHAAVIGRAGGEPATAPAAALPTVQEMAAAETDVWGEAAMRQPDGASYDFFAGLLPPLRWVNTEFRHYPIMLSAPLAAQKVRLISNGSAINPRANKPPMWKESGFAVAFSVGEPDEPYGGNIERLDGPRYAEGWLPIVQTTYRSGGATYAQEVFAPVEPDLTAAGAVFVRFTLAKGDAGRVTARVDFDHPIHMEQQLRDEAGRCLVVFGPHWKWNESSRELRADLRGGDSCVLVIFTVPAAKTALAATAEVYEQHRQTCATCWRDRLARAVRLETPEPMVNDAWRSMVVGNEMVAVGDRMHYSAGNAYDHLYEAESGDAVRAMMLYGYIDEARRMIGPLFEFDRQATRFHVAGHKLQLLAHYYWITRDAAYIRERRSMWRPVVDLIVTSRQPAHGLLPPDRYAGDIAEDVYSLHSNANCWRGLRDMSVILDEIGKGDEAGSAEFLAEARRVRDVAADFRKSILDAVARSERHDVRPPYIPVALLGREPPPIPLTSTRNGSYYCLVAPYTLGSDIFGHGSQREQWLLDWFQQHGGIAMGMVRSTPHQGQFKDEPGVNVLYGLRYQLTLLRRDEREKVLVGFYGQLAQGMTRETFIGGEGSRFVHGDEQGRSFYLPPNTTSNAIFMQTLRYLLVQDWDLDEDGLPDTLRLLYAAPRRWLDDGRTIRLERVPTAFGEISIETESRLAHGEFAVNVAAPPRPVRHLSLRAPLPRAWTAVSAHVGGEILALGPDAT
ncbi:MAG: hypothetical protein HY718_01435, partial [Planctomycetes bacterium]|nr:hypothetical protein [Planctomycetota bacterium]